MITDNSMPKLSGVELVKKVRSAGMTLPSSWPRALPTEVDRNPRSLPPRCRSLWQPRFAEHGEKSPVQPRVVAAQIEPLFSGESAIFE
jgi:hypothetical protein